MFSSKPDMGRGHQSYEGDPFARHVRRCPYCRGGGRPVLCEGYQALVADYDRNTTPAEGVPTMGELVFGGKR